LIAVPLVYNILSGFHFGDNKLYMREAGVWVKMNIPIEATLLTNDTRLQYYSGRKFDFSPEMRALVVRGKIKKKVLFNQDYLLLRLKKGKPLRVFEEALEEVKAFDNGKGEKAVLYKVKRAAYSLQVKDELV
jgi:hypothetical protein